MEAKFDPSNSIFFVAEAKFDPPNSVFSVCVFMASDNWEVFFNFATIFQQACSIQIVHIWIFRYPSKIPLWC